MSVQIRLAGAQDAPAIAALYRPIVERTAISFETEAPDAAAIAQRIRETLTAYPGLVCESAGEIAGYAYATRHRVRGAYRWSVDTSVYVDERQRRRGVGRGLYASLFAILSAQGFFNVYAGIALPNPASVMLHESVGFTAIGVYRRVGFKLGAWHDVGWWQRTLQEQAADPREPLSIAEMRQHPSWQALLRHGESAIRAAAA